MSLLVLSPEASRLRRVAKACAAGELSRSEYREARRHVIRQYATTSEPVEQDDTRPRYIDETTQRRTDSARRVSDTPPRRRKPWLWLALLAALALVFSQSTLADAQFTDRTAAIPALKDRDPNPATSRRIAVQSVNWQVDGSLTKLSQAAVDALLERELQAIKESNAPADHGFVAAELEEVGRYLNALGAHDDAAQLTQQDLNDLMALIAEQKQRRGVSLVQLEQIAQVLERYVRDQGYPLARAYLPSQEVHDGRVRLDLQAGVLASVVVEGDQPKFMQGWFNSLLAKPVTRRTLETQLNALNQQPGITASATFVPGSAVGETELVVQVDQERGFSGSVGIDNYGVEAFGAERLSFNGEWINPRGAGDRLRGEVATAIDGDYDWLGLAYQTPIATNEYQVGARLGYGNVELTRPGEDLSGDSLLLDLSLTDKQLVTRSRRREVSYLVGVHQFDWQQLFDQQAWFVGAALSGHRLWDEQQVALEGSADLRVGQVDTPQAGQDDTFWRLRAQLRVWRPVTLPWLDVDAKWVTHFRGQYAQDVLPPTLRLGATGPQANRGFEQGALLLDQGFGVSQELRFASGLRHWWLYLDATYGELLGPIDRWRSVTSFGVGWESELLRRESARLRSRVTLGYPLSHQGRGGFEDDGAQLFWSLRYDR